jgi:hypothetical protein
MENFKANKQNKGNKQPRYVGVPENCGKKKKTKKKKRKGKGETNVSNGSGTWTKVTESCVRVTYVGPFTLDVSSTTGGLWCRKFPEIGER